MLDQRTVKVGAPLEASRPAPQASHELEDMGYDYATTGEHVSFHAPVANGFVALAAAAGATTWIGLLSTVTLLPLYPPVLAAKLVAELARHSEGRFALGVGVGGEFPAEFQAVGVPTRERVARTDEALEVISALLRDDKVSHSGRFAEFEGLTIAPRPEVPPEVWIGGRKGSAFDRAARHGDVWFPHFVSPRSIEAGLADIRGRAAALGRDPADLTAGIHLWTTLGESRDHVRDVATTALSTTYGTDMSAAVDQYALVGNAEECLERLHAYHDAGVRRFVLAPLHIDPSQRQTMLQGIAESMLPACKEM